MKREVLLLIQSTPISTNRELQTLWSIAAGTECKSNWQLLAALSLGQVKSRAAGSAVLVSVLTFNLKILS